MVSREHRTYSTRPGLVLGFHGTDKSVVNDVVLQKAILKSSTNPWDWLGHGIYFWEHSLSRAIEFAVTTSRRKNSSIKEPAVIGAVLDLGNCLDLLDYENLALVRRIHNDLSDELKFIRNRESAGEVAGEFRMRDLDCLVVEGVHVDNAERGLPPFDSVRAAFCEGSLLYPTAGFREKNHIQICIRNPNCIKGFFLPYFN